MSTADQDTNKALDTSNTNRQASGQENEHHSNVDHSTAQFPQNQGYQSFYTAAFP